MGTPRPNLSLQNITLESAQAVASTHVEPIQLRSKAIREASSALEDQEKQLRKQTAQLAKQSAKWAKLTDKGTKELKEIGDVRNWAEVVERELLMIEEVLRIVEEKGSRTEPTSNTRPEDLHSSGVKGRV